MYWALVEFVKRHSKFVWGFTIAWLIGHWGDLAVLWDAASNWIPLVVLFAFFEATFVIGLLVVMAAVVRHLFPGAGYRPRFWLVAFHMLRRNVGATVAPVRNSGTFKVGLYLNWVGAAMVAGVLPLVLIPLLLPSSSWPLMVIPAVDLLLTFASRMTLQRRRLGVES
ncbi:hypothetical protein [Saccharopolyspora pogona]|uniref:hypothetical protein n=1 Tax=Saccharopolyspora pogona TaxID=333966 RepID=UPI0016871F25|nr:hypothetical protein [Saccharopolyspora pogona]